MCRGFLSIQACVAGYALTYVTTLKGRGREPERAREEKDNFKVMRGTTFGGWQETISPVLKVPRQCPLVLLLDVMNMIGNNF
jgi:hypothetical protein